MLRTIYIDVAAVSLEKVEKAYHNERVDTNHVERSLHAMWHKHERPGSRVEYPAACFYRSIY